MSKTYEDVIESKMRKPRQYGFEPRLPLNEKLFEWQKLLVTWAVRKGRAALFAECGLGKTLMQLEWARQVLHRNDSNAEPPTAIDNRHVCCVQCGGKFDLKQRHVCDPAEKVLILCPLAVAEQTVAEGARFGYTVRHVRENEQVAPGINITNYDRVSKFDLSQFVGVILDESSILKSLTGKTSMALIEAFSETPYRLCCTATPAPNDYMEFGRHSEFLGVLSSREMFATWFVNDTADTGTWRLKGHARKDFWRWMSTWAACVGKPSDLGFPDDGFILPPLKIEVVQVAVDGTPTEDGELFRLPNLSASNLHSELRITSEERTRKVAEMVNASSEPWLVWCFSNMDADNLKNAIPDSVEVRGNDTEEKKEQAAEDFCSGAKRVLISKPSIFGFGLNFQHCRNHIFAGLTYSFEDFYQAMRRGYRFGQTKPFNCYIVQAETMSDTMQTIQRKLNQFEAMRDEMKFAAETLLTEHGGALTVKNHVTKASGERWTLYHGDCVRVAKLMDEASIDFSVFSPPFANLFVYSDDAQDMGNCTDEQEFGEQFQFLVKELHRITKPGRLCAVHCQDLLSTKWKDGEIELKNFSGLIVDWFRNEDWVFHSRVTIWKDPVTEMQRTKALGLLHKQLLKDSAMSRTGLPEYLLVFRKRGQNAEPIHHEREDYPVELWQRDASPVWMDIRQERTLNGTMARDSQDERHICPLQLDTIERALRLWSNPGDLVFSPFAGVGSEGHCALRLKRRFIGSELKASYFHHACEYLKAVESESVDLFTK